MSQTNAFLIPGAIVIAGAMIAGAVVFTSPGVATNQVGLLAATAPAPAPAQPIEISFEVADFPTLGSPDAPVTIVEYSDFSCPFCKRFVDETKPRIIEEFIDAGLVRFVRKDFIAVGGQAAAEAAHCAGDQGAYWQYHTELIANQPADRARWNDPDVHRGYATRLGLNVADFMACLEAGTHVDRINTSTREAVANGGQGTPFFIINGVPVSGAQPFTVFEQVITAALADA